MMTLRAVKFAAAMILALGAAACSSNKDGLADGAAGGFGAGGAATPGSAQDFVVNVGDRVFFETDSDRSHPHRRRDPRQAGAVARSAIRATPSSIEGHADERGTREYNFSLSARRAQNVRDYLVSRGIVRQPHPHRVLRQGAAGRGVQRHLVLVAEPPRRDGARGRRLLTGGRYRRGTPGRSSGPAVRAGHLRSAATMSPWRRSCVIGRVCTAAGPSGFS